MYTYPYPHPSITADCVVFGYDKHRLYVLLIRRKHPPCMDMWAFPGGFMNIDEDVESCARRELLEETGLGVARLYQFGVYSAPDRDPRERVVSVAYYTLIPLCMVKGADDAAEARWFPVDDLPPLAFDHDRMLADSLRNMRLIANVLPIIEGIMPSKFTMQQLFDVYVSVSGVGMDINRLQSRLVDMGVIEMLEEGLFCFKQNL